MAAAACGRTDSPAAGAAGSPAASAASASTAAVAPAPENDPLFVAKDLPLLPYGAQAAPRPLAAVKAAYEFAARHPDVIGYIPCFCGCERGGHKSNESCFVAGRTNGRITWDNHGVGCGICLDVALETMQMYNAGADVAKIRKLIEAKYAPVYPGHTPTPAPPTRGGTQH